MTAIAWRRGRDIRPPSPASSTTVKHHLALALAKGIIAILFAGACAFVPLAEWAPIWALQVQVPVTGVLLVCYLGKLLYDTLFYDHYWP